MRAREFTPRSYSTLKLLIQLWIEREAGYLLIRRFALESNLPINDDCRDSSHSIVLRLAADLAGNVMFYDLTATACNCILDRLNSLGTKRTACGEYLNLSSR